MDYNQTDIEDFIKTFQFFNKKLSGETSKRSYISIGSHLFINFGEEFESTHANGKPYKKSPWTIWMGANVDWRLSQNGKFIVGSCQPYDKMNAEVQRLVGKKYLSCSIISQLMDIQFEFEDGYVLSSFFSILLQEQWTLFCSNGNNIGLDAETIEEVKQIQQLSNHFDIQNLFNDIILPINQKALTGFSLEKMDLHLFFDNNLTLCLDGCSWRIEKNNEYCIGAGEFSLDDYPDIHQYLDGIKEKRLLNSSVTNPFQDARFEFEDGYVIKTFSCYKDTIPWRIMKNNQEEVYAAKIVFADSPC
jgi:hypothetical protein